MQITQQKKRLYIHSTNSCKDRLILAQIAYILNESNSGDIVAVRYGFFGGFSVRALSNINN